ncbi:MAG: transposase [Sedimenticolaceae bacterium]
MMFKALVLQYLFNLSDDQTELQIRDRYSFYRFLGLSPEGKVSDARTVWIYRECLKEWGLYPGNVIRERKIGRSKPGIALRRGVITNAARRMLQHAGL